MFKQSELQFNAQVTLEGNLFFTSLIYDFTKTEQNFF